MTTNDKVIAYVQDKAINIAALANKMGMHYQTAYDTFSGKGNKRSIKADELLVFCKIMDVNPMEFRNDEV